MVILSASEIVERASRLLVTLEQLLSLDAISFLPTLDKAAGNICTALSADKVDIFLYETKSQSLVAMGVSNTPMGRREKTIGMDRLPLANGGLAVEVFRTGKSVTTGHANRVSAEVRGLVDGLGVRSELIVAFDVAGERRGVLQAFSAKEAYFHPDDDLPFLEAVGRWIGIVVHRIELVEQLTSEAAAKGRMEGASEVLTLLTPRQRQIAELVASGMTNEAIGNQLFLTRGSVANHVERIRRRLNVSRRTQIATLVAGSRR